MQHATEIDPALVARYGNRFLVDEVPSMDLPEEGMPAPEAMRLIAEDLTLEGNPQRNLATFVTTWMEPEAQRIIAENLHRNFIDHAEYPRTAEIEQRCIRMLAGLFHAPGKTVGARTQGSSEAIMLGALSLKWNWRKRREAAGKPVDRPNLVFGGDVHVVWEKFCRYFDVEPRIVPLQEHRYTIGPEDVEPHVDENTIGVAAVLGTTFTGQSDDIPGINALLAAIESREGLHVPLHVDAASGGFVWPFLYPDSEWDFRLSHVHSINVSGHKFGLVYPGIGWLIFREPRGPQRGPRLLRELPRKDRRDVHAQLLDRLGDGAGPVLQPHPTGARGLQVRDGDDAAERRACLRITSRQSGDFELIGRDEEQLPLVAFRLAEQRSYDEFDIAWQLSAERGWMVPAYTLPPNAQHVTMMRALVKETLSREMVDTLAGDIARACQTLDDKGGLHESERQQVKTATGY